MVVARVRVGNPICGDMSSLHTEDSTTLLCSPTLDE